MLSLGLNLALDRLDRGRFGPPDPFSGITFTRRFQTNRGDVGSIGTYYTGDGYVPIAGDYYPNGDTADGRPVYATLSGKTLSSNAGVWQFRDAASSLLAEQTAPQTLPTNGDWDNGGASAFPFNIYTPIGLYQDIARTIPAEVLGDPVASFFEELRANGTAAIQATSSQQPIVYFIQGVPFVSNDGIDDRMLNTIPTLGQCTFAIVARINNVSANTGVVCIASNAQDDFNAPGGLLWNNNSSPPGDPAVEVFWNGGLGTSSFIVAQGVPILITGTITGTTSTAVKVWQNGVLKLDLTGAQAVSNAVTQMAFGCRLLNGSIGQSFFSLSDIGAILITPDTTTPTRQLIETTLIDLYNI